jgi:hypothetical protein
MPVDLPRSLISLNVYPIQIRRDNSPPRSICVRGISSSCWAVSLLSSIERTLLYRASVVRSSDSKLATLDAKLSTNF